MSGPHRWMRPVLVGVLSVAAGCGDSRGARTTDQQFTESIDSARVKVIAFSRYVELNVGEAPQMLWAVLERDGSTDTLRAARVAIEDTSVIGVRGGALVARRAGTSEFFALFGGTRLRGVAVVSERVFVDTVHLAIGQVRAWELAPANYEIAVRPIGQRGAPSPLELVADITCATDGRDAELVHCLVRTPTRFVLRHNAVSPSGSRASALVSITKVR